METWNFIFSLLLVKLIFAENGFNPCFAVMLVFNKRRVYLFLLLINYLPQWKKEYFMI